MLVSKSNKVPCCLCCTIVPCNMNMQVLLMRRKDDERDKGGEEDVCVKVLAECRRRGLLLGAAVDHGQLQDPSTTARPTPSSPFCICTYIHICFTICCTCLYFYLHLYMFHYLHIPFFWICMCTYVCIFICKTDQKLQQRDELTGVDLTGIWLIQNRCWSNIFLVLGLLQERVVS